MQKEIEERAGQKCPWPRRAIATQNPPPKAAAKWRSRIESRIGRFYADFMHASTKLAHHRTVTGTPFWVCRSIQDAIEWGMDFQPYHIVVVLVVAIAIWIAYKLFQYFIKKALFLAYIAIAFIVFLMIAAAYLYFRYSSQWVDIYDISTQRKKSWLATTNSKPQRLPSASKTPSTSSGQLSHE